MPSFFGSPFVNGEIYPCVSQDVYDALPSMAEEALEEWYGTVGDWWMMACPEECDGRVSLNNIMDPNNHATITVDGEIRHVFAISGCDDKFMEFFADYVGDFGDACVWITSTQDTAGF